jgi:hypothetical protein
MLSTQAYYVMMLAVCAYAFWQGRSDERIVAAVCVIATIASNVVVAPMGSRYSSVEAGILLVDIGAFAGFTWVALRSERFWPLWVAALQLTTVIAHMLKGVQLDLMPQAYAAAARFWVYPIFLIIVAGTWRSARRRAESRRIPAPA